MEKVKTLWKHIKELFWIYIKLWWRVNVVGSILMLIALAGLVVSFVGFPKEIDETLDACVYTESGETMFCQIQVKGEVTKYPFRKYSEYDICAYREHILVSEMDYNTSEQQYGYCHTYRFTGIKDIERVILVVEMDLHTLFPEEESQRCMIVAPALERSEALEIVNNSGDYEIFKAPFAWCKP